MIDAAYRIWHSENSIISRKRNLNGVIGMLLYFADVSTPCTIIVNAEIVFILESKKDPTEAVPTTGLRSDHVGAILF